MLNVKIVRYFIGLIVFLNLTISCKEKNKVTPPINTFSVKQTPTNLIKIGDEFSRKGNYEEALNYFTRAYKQLKESRNEEETAILLNNLGLVHWRLADNNAAMECYVEAAEIAQTLGMKRLLALTYTNRALIYKEERKFDVAFEHNNVAIRLFKEINEPRDLAIAYNNQGQIYRFSGELDSAKKYYLLSLDECKKINYLEGIATANQNLSNVYAKQGNKNKALFAVHQCLDFSYQVKSKVRISEGLLEISHIYDQFQVHDSALYYFKKYYEVDKEILESNQSELLSKNQASLGLEVKNLRIKNLQNEKEITRTRVLLVTVIAIFALLVAAVFVYRYLSIIKFRKKEVELKLENSLELIKVKEDELKSYILDLTDKNNIINKMQEQHNQKVETAYDLEDLMKHKIFTDDGWDKFKMKFAAIYPDFFGRIKESGFSITEAEVRILVLMRLNLNGKNMANILGISPQSVRACKMRLKKKLQLNNYETVEEYLDFIVS